MGITSAITSSEPKSKPQRLHSTNQHSDGKYSIAWRWRRKATSPRWNSASRLNRRIVTATHRASRPRTPSHLPHPLERNILRLQHHNVAIPDRVLRLRLHRHPPNPNQRSPNPKHPASGPRPHSLLLSPARYSYSAVLVICGAAILCSCQAWLGFSSGVSSLVLVSTHLCWISAAHCKG